MKQNVCLIAALGLFLAAAAVIETHFDWSFVLIAAMTIPMYIGGLDKKRVTVKDIERRYRDAENR